MKLANALLVAAGLGLSVVVWSLVQASGNEVSVPRDLAADADRVADLEDRVERLSRSAQSAHARVNRLASRGAPPPRGEDPARPVSEDEERPDGDTETDDAVPFEVTLEDAFASGATDTEWTRGAPAEAEEALRELLPDGSYLEGLECRGSLCRVEIRHGADAGHADFVQTLMQTRPRWSGPGSYTRVQQADGTERTLAFLGEPGSDLVEGSVWGPNR